MVGGMIFLLETAGLPAVITPWLRCSVPWHELQLELGVGVLELVDRSPGTLGVEALRVYSESV
jgi:hypothetical protein